MLANVLSVELMNIFFDESGTKKDKPTTMGGLLIPQKIYNTYEFNKMKSKLQNHQYAKLHWTEYTGYKRLKDDIIEVLTTFASFAKYCKFNIINYNENPLDIRKGLYNQDHVPAEKLSQIMVYTKIPERILYGLLRNYGKDVYIKSTLYIEHSNRYEDFKLTDRLLEQLNIQSMYRGEQFSVIGSHYKNKREEIGVEIVDLLLGFVRQIIRNEIVPFGLSDDEIKKHKLKGRKAKNDLAIELLKNSNIYTFLSNIKYYEWESNNELKERKFSEYLQLFMASHIHEFREEHNESRTQKPRGFSNPNKKPRYRSKRTAKGIIKI
ncbi:DUF3800 domain-containing protein [Cytobacillus gottheilii]|uniref:DUF3800 domain-containing protein n=1 Tax=Cytobacillus gottheilii TaxID=859144 RepID=UPI0024957515|nr:DUF3800 domain-containing protein [Cytobacillus gottheilii]